MSRTLRTDPTVFLLARNLGLASDVNPADAVVHYCEKKLGSFLRELPTCDDLETLLQLARDKAGTCFEVVRTDREVAEVKKKYIARKEKMFARLGAELSEDVFGITFRLLNSDPGDLEYVSVIDCRGEKESREYFTKWHEIAHLLTQPKQMRLMFRRTHVKTEQQDAEEYLMDRIAGRIGFFPPIIQRYAKGRASFQSIDDLRERLCPSASRQSATLGIVRAWPAPCLLVEARLGLKRGEYIALSKGKFNPGEEPVPELRAVRVAQSDSAKRTKLFIPWNMRIPKGSVIFSAFNDNVTDAEASENLGWWTASSGTQLPKIPVFVRAKRLRDSVQALIIPLN